MSLQPNKPIGSSPVPRRHALTGRAAVVPFLLSIVVALAACTSSGGASSSTGGGAAIGVATVSVGKILVDSRGRSLYLFEKDTGSTSNCSGACAGSWPPLLTNGAPSVTGGLQASLLGTTSRSDGTTQVTFNGHPLYTYSGDSKAGDTNGEGSKAFGAGWYVLSPAGVKIDKD